jgi:hypothetical protein
MPKFSEVCAILLVGIFAVGVSLSFIGGALLREEAALAKCLENHSLETCKTQLN